MKKKIDPFSPLSLLVAFVAAGVILPIWPFLEGEDGFSIAWPYFFDDKEAAVLLALLAYGLALISFWFVYRIVIGRRQSKFGNSARKLYSRLLLRKAGHVPRSFFVFIGFSLLSVAATIILLGGVSEFLHAGGDRIRAFAGLNFVVLFQNTLVSVGVAWMLLLTHEKWSWRRLAVWGFCIYVIFSIFIVALQGAKSAIFVYVVALAVVRHYRIKRFAGGKLLVMGLVMYILLMLYHLVKQEYLVVGHFVSIQPDNVLGSLIKFMVLQFTGNLMELQTMAVLIDGMPRTLDYQYGATLAMVFLIWLPSLLFPAKPPTAPGVFTLAFWPNKWILEATTMPPGYFGEMYMNFGWVGIVLGGILAGVVYGRSFRKIRDNPECDLSLGRHALLVALILHYFRGELASVTVLFFSIYVPFWLIMRLSARRKVGAVPPGVPAPTSN
ncbi:O-antigen polymerase [Pandoraea cepalis]|uniref:Oligosaccharide repeat unit polymerase n=1 Tax=Pandoraea cepalis TaxID=2508294 RepID=A0A5E4YMJ3_9BURK|nr:O-antigen polymerase [Pandoraea cepalis]VVE50064.1 hypothetical protein PCE31107_04644 [Pandoraea cepalis]